MKLYGSAASPYARTVRVLILEKGLENRIAWEAVDPMADPPELVAVNPLGLVPALARDDGPPLFDSTVIADYVDALAEPRLIPADGEARWTGARLRAAAKGVLDAAIRMVQEQRRPEEMRSGAWLARWQAAIARTCDLLEAEAESFERAEDLPALSVGVALGYLDFRLPHVDWRAGRPRLEAFFEEAVQRPSMVATSPA
jgi:glutathione S-transferase